PAGRRRAARSLTRRSARPRCWIPAPPHRNQDRPEWSQAAWPPGTRPPRSARVCRKKYRSSGVCLQRQGESGAQAVACVTHINGAAQVMPNITFDQASAETAPLWFLHGLTGGFTPDDLQLGRRMIDHAPVDRHPSIAMSQGAVFRGIGGQLMENHAQRQGSGWRKSDKRPVQTQPSCPVRADRKSTRLNSSHVKISYAVFC